MSEVRIHSAAAIPPAPFFPAPHAPFRDDSASRRMSIAIAVSLIANLALLTGAGILADRGHYAALPSDRKEPVSAPSILWTKVAPVQPIPAPSVVVSTPAHTSTPQAKKHFAHPIRPVVRRIEKLSPVRQQRPGAAAAIATTTRPEAILPRHTVMAAAPVQVAAAATTPAIVRPQTTVPSAVTSALMATTARAHFARTPTAPAEAATFVLTTRSPLAHWSHPIVSGHPSRNSSLVSRGSAASITEAAVATSPGQALRTSVTRTQTSAASTVVSLHTALPSEFQSETSLVAPITTAATAGRSLIARVQRTAGVPLARHNAFGFEGIRGGEQAVLSSSNYESPSGTPSDGSRYASTGLRHGSGEASTLSGVEGSGIRHGNDDSGPIVRKRSAEEAPHIVVRPVTTPDDDNRAAGVIRSARLLEFADPEIPESLRRTKLDVRVETRVTVFASGQHRVEIIHGSGYPELDHAIVAALQASKYQAASRSGEAVDSTLPVTIPVTNK